jgi:hypothetical protein
VEHLPHDIITPTHRPTKFYAQLTKPHDASNDENPAGLRIRIDSSTTIKDTTHLRTRLLYLSALSPSANSTLHPHEHEVVKGRIGQCWRYKVGRNRLRSPLSSGRVAWIAIGRQLSLQWLLSRRSSSRQFMKSTPGEVWGHQIPPTPAKS